MTIIGDSASAGKPEGANGHVSTNKVKPEQRFTRGQSCPVCGGSEDDKRGQRERCHGFLSEDGQFAHCTREEHAGSSPHNPWSKTYIHRLKGKCPCGKEHSPEDPKPKRPRAGLGRQVAAYPYPDAAGHLVIEVVRYADPKGFRQRRPLPDGKWAWNVEGVELVPYRLPELAAAKTTNRGRVVHIVEGEKDADSLAALGLLATTNPGGAGKWRDSFSEHLRGRNVIIFPDNDQAGREHAEQVARSLHGKAESIRVVELPGVPDKGDVTDWIRSGGNLKSLHVLVSDWPFWSPPAVAHRGANPESPKRPTILITTEEHEVNDQAVAALAADETIYQRGFMLVTVQRDSAPSQGIIRPPGSPRICALPQARLRERLTKHAQWVKSHKSRNGETVTVAAHPTEWVVSAVAVRGEWPSVRPLEAVIETPVLRHDGTILDVPGYDPSTGLLYEPNAVFPAIKAMPTHLDAKAAADLLLDLVLDFPFPGGKSFRCHRAAWLAALLTALGRFAIAGPCPLFLFDATAAGSGKGLLADLIAFIRTGRTIARKDYPDDNDELRKTITAIALAGDPFVLLDNINGPLGGSALDGALTAQTWKDRILGRSEMSPDLPLFTLWFATGNNVTLRGDIMRRIIPCRLEPQVERPEERTDFKYPKLMDHVRRHRPELVAAALTILRAYFVAGRPDQKLTPLGSFEAWSDVVRSAIVWTIGDDPCKARDDLRAADDTAINAASIIEGWDELPNGRTGYTTAEAIKLLKGYPDKFDILREAFMSWSRSDELPTQRVVGNRLKAMLGKVVKGRFMHSTPGRGGFQIWSVRPVAPLSRGDSGDSGESCSNPSRGNCDDNCNTNSGEKGIGKSHQTHQSHHPSCGGCLRLECPECNP